MGTDLHSVQIIFYIATPIIALSTFAYNIWLNKKHFDKVDKKLDHLDECIHRLDKRIYDLKKS